MSVEKKLSRENKKKLVEQLINGFETYLKAKGVVPEMLINPSRTEKDKNNIICGIDYKFLSDNIRENMKVLEGKLQKKDNFALALTYKGVIDGIYASFWAIKARIQNDIEWTINDNAELKSFIMEVFHEYEVM